jgi:6-phosphogluconolactonase
MGEYPCHLTLAPDGSSLFVANYGGGVSRLPLGADGAVGAGGSLIVPPLPRSRAHWVGFRDGTLWVADFGHDCLRLMDQSGREVHTVRFPSGAGPRTIAWHPHLPFCFVACESDNTVRVVSTPAGEPRIMGEHSLLPSGVRVRSVAAHVAVDATGRFLYASNRGHDSIAVFEVSETGGLTSCGHGSSGGAHPRHFTLDPSGRWLIIANRDSNNLVPIPVHQGRAGQPGKPADLRAASWVKFVNAE